MHQPWFSLVNSALVNSFHRSLYLQFSVEFIFGRRIRLRRHPQRDDVGFLNRRGGSAAGFRLGRRLRERQAELHAQGHHFKASSVKVLGPKLLLVMGCEKMGEKNCVHLPSVGEQTAN